MSLFQIAQAFSQYREAGLPLAGALRVGALYVTAGEETPIPSVFAASLATTGHTPDWDELRALVDASREMVPRTYLAGQPVTLKGTPAEGLFILHAGAVRVDGGDVEQGAMSVHGAWGAFTQGSSRHTVVATRPSILLRLDLPAVDRLARACPAAARALCAQEPRTKTDAGFGVG